MNEEAMKAAKAAKACWVREVKGRVQLNNTLLAKANMTLDRVPTPHKKYSPASRHVQRFYSYLTTY
jgi:hypothetical protein